MSGKGELWVVVVGVGVVRGILRLTFSFLRSRESLHLMSILLTYLAMLEQGT